MDTSIPLGRNLSAVAWRHRQSESRVELGRTPIPHLWVLDVFLLLPRAYLGMLQIEAGILEKTRHRIGGTTSFPLTDNGWF